MWGVCTRHHSLYNPPQAMPWANVFVKHTGPFTSAHIVYLWVVSAIAAVVLLSLSHGNFNEFVPSTAKFEIYTIYFLLAITVRFLSTSAPVFGRFALDTSIYIGSFFVFGAAPTAGIVFVAMGVHGIVDWAHRRTRKIKWPLSVSLGRIVFYPTLTAAIVMILGRIPGWDDHANLFEQSGNVAGLWFLLVALILLTAQLFLVVVAHRLNNVGWRMLFRGLVGPGMMGELMFLPLGFSLAVTTHEEDSSVVGTMAIAYVIFNVIVRHTWKTDQELKEQARELRVVEEAGRAVASTFDVEEVARRIGMAILSYVRRAEGMVLTVGDDPKDLQRQYARASERKEKPAIMAACAKAINADFDLGLDDSTLLARYGALPFAGEVINNIIEAPETGKHRGYLSVVMKAGVSPDPEDRRLVQNLARQVAVAVENWRLYNMATEDGLTGLFVRRYIETRLAEEFERASRSGSPFCLLIVDVDDLKGVNDRFGHQAGDDLLRAVATGIRQSIRAMDAAGRWGGDEFALLLPEMGLSEGLTMARRLTEQMQKQGLSFPPDITIVPSISIGVAAFPDSQPVDATGIFRLADEALYRVKHSGQKGTVVAARSSRST